MWIFCSRQLNNLINKLQEQALRIIHSKYDSFFSEFLEMSSEDSINIYRIKVLMTKIHKFLNDP